MCMLLHNLYNILIFVHQLQFKNGVFLLLLLLHPKGYVFISVYMFFCLRDGLLKKLLGNFHEIYLGGIGQETFG